MSGLPIQLVIEKYPEGEDYIVCGGKPRASGRCYVDEETGQPIIRVRYPPTGTELQKKRALAKVLRHEIGHAKLHLGKYSEGASRTRETRPEEWLEDEIDVAVWEYSRSGKLSPLRSRMKELAEAYLWRSRRSTRAMSRTEAYDRVSLLLAKSSESQLGSPVKLKYAGTMDRGFK